MKPRRFKFRYANEITGAFVMLAVVLFVAAVVLTGRSQQWLEGTFELQTLFGTEEGAYGLQEGNEVKVRNIVAGHVDRITPTSDGKMTATLVIKNAYQQFIYKNSIGYVSKVYGLAGDSFVRIRLPDGAKKAPPVEDGDSLVCEKDKELMDEATRILGQVEEAILPVAAEMETLLHHSASIARGINDGTGLAGTLVRDQEFADQAKEVMAHTGDLVLELEEMTHEITRLVKGFQKSWLVRKHIEDEQRATFLYPLSVAGVEVDKVVTRTASRLDAARAADSSAGIVMNAYNLAICALEAGDYAGATARLPEIRAELAGAGQPETRLLILQSEIARRRGKPAAAAMFAKAALELTPRDDKELALLCRLLIAEAQCDAGDVDAALAGVRRIVSLRRKADSTVLKAMVARALARIAALNGDWAQSGDYHDAQAGYLRAQQLHSAMAEAITAAGRANEKVGNLAVAADRYFRAGRSLYYEENVDAAERILKEAAEVASRAHDKYISEQVAQLLDAIAEKRKAESSES